MIFHWGLTPVFCCCCKPDTLTQHLVAIIHFVLKTTNEKFSRYHKYLHISVSMSTGGEWSQACRSGCWRGNRGRGVVVTTMASPAAEHVFKQGYLKKSVASDLLPSTSQQIARNIKQVRACLPYIKSSH